MLLIRPWLRMNKYRVTGHHVMFFIFIISNVGGCLTPVGDPPLFLGYLMGVPFWWVAEHGFLIWSVGVGTLLLMFYAVDSRNFHRAPKTVRLEETQAGEHWRFDGLKNIFFLGVILAAVFIHDPPFLREILMLAAAVLSYFTTPKTVHESNHFNLQPIKEVAILFIGIFATMMPALDWLQANAGGINSPTLGFFYAGSGGLSSVLDNPPTYLCFFQPASGRFIHPAAVTSLLNSCKTTAPAWPRWQAPMRRKSAAPSPTCKNPILPRWPAAWPPATKCKSPFELGTSNSAPTSWP